MAQTIGVQCRRLDSLVDQIGPAKAIFCDAEGVETLILRGAQQFIIRHQPVLVLEASPKLLVRAGSNLTELHQTIQSFGYRAFAIGRFALRPVTDLAQTRSCNWCCVPDAKSELIGRASASIVRCGLLPCLRGWNPLCR